MKTRPEIIEQCHMEIVSCEDRRHFLKRVSNALSDSKNGALIVSRNVADAAHSLFYSLNSDAEGMKIEHLFVDDQAPDNTWILLLPDKMVESSRVMKTEREMKLEALFKIAREALIASQEALNCIDSGSAQRHISMALGKIERSET